MTSYEAANEVRDTAFARTGLACWNVGLALLEEYSHYSFQSSIIKETVFPDCSGCLREL